ncbi:MAG: hypothetical protein ACOYJC_02655 [Christensenellales bacterium]|jgi:hypothetical protein
MDQKEIKRAYKKVRRLSGEALSAYLAEILPRLSQEEAFPFLQYLKSDILSSIVYEATGAQLDLTKDSVETLQGFLDYVRGYLDVDAGKLLPSAPAVLQEYYHHFYEEALKQNALAGREQVFDIVVYRFASLIGAYLGELIIANTPRSVWRIFNDEHLFHGVYNGYLKLNVDHKAYANLLHGDEETITKLYQIGVTVLSG